MQRASRVVNYMEPVVNQSLEQFRNEAFLNLETYRQDGQGVKTPVWFVQQGNTLYVRTGRDSWKVKRLRRNSRARIVPSDAVGNPRGQWIAARAAFVEDGERTQQIRALFDAKYGAQTAMFDEIGEERLVTLAFRSEPEP